MHPELAPNIHTLCVHLESGSCAGEHVEVDDPSGAAENGVSVIVSVLT